MQPISNKDRYVIVKAKEHLCLAASLEMILKAIGIFTMSQELIAEYFGLNVPEDYLGEIKNLNIVFDKMNFGIKIKEEGLNPFFKKYNIPLTEEYVSIYELFDWEFEMLIEKALNQKKHILCGFDYGILNNDKSMKIGHISIISGIQKNIVEIIDPDPVHLGIRNIKSYILYRAIHSIKDGVWVLSQVHR